MLGCLSHDALDSQQKQLRSGLSSSCAEATRVQLATQAHSGLKPAPSTLARLPDPLNSPQLRSGLCVELC